MGSCSIPSCVNYNRLVTDVGLYPVPEDKNARILWMQAFCLKDIMDSTKCKDIKVCGEHFRSRRSKCNASGVSGTQLVIPTIPSQKTDALIKQVKSKLPSNYAVRVVGVFNTPVNKNTPSPQGIDVIQSAPTIVSVNSEVSEERPATISRNNVVSGVTVSGCTLKSHSVLSTVSNTSECANDENIVDGDKEIHNVSSNVDKTVIDIDLDLECEEEDLSTAQENALDREWLGWVSTNKGISESSTENMPNLSVTNFSESVTENSSKSTIEGSYEFIPESNESMLPGAIQSGLPFVNNIKLPEAIPLTCIPAVNPLLSGTIPYREPLLNPSTFVSSSANIASAPTFVTPASNLLLLTAQHATSQSGVPPRGSAPTLFGTAINNTESSNYPKMSKFPINESIIPNLEIDEENSRGTPNADLSKVVVVYETSDGPTDSPLVKETLDTSEVSTLEESNIAEDPESEEILPGLSSAIEGFDIGRKRSYENHENEESLRKVQKLLSGTTYSKSEISSIQSQESITYSKFNMTPFEAQTPSFLSAGQHVTFPTMNLEGYSEKQHEKEMLQSGHRAQVPSTLAVNASQTSILSNTLPQMSPNQSARNHTQKDSNGPVILSVIGSVEDVSGEDEIQKVFQEDSPGDETSCGIRKSTTVLSLNYLRGIAVPYSIFSMQANIPIIPAGEQYFNTRNLLNIKCCGTNFREKYFNELKCRLRKTDFLTSSLSWLLEKKYLPKNPPCNLCGGKVFTLTKDKRFFDGFCWLCDVCHCAEPVKRPKFFQQFLFISIEDLLLLTFHWACQSDLDTILEDVDLDLSKIWSYFKALQKLCKYVVGGKKLGLPSRSYKLNNKIEIAVVKLGNFFILGMLDRATKITGLEVMNIDEACYTDRHLHLIRQWIWRDSIIITEKRIDSCFLPEARSTWPADARILNPDDIRNHILNVKTYLWTNMRAMFGKFRHDELDRTTIQGFLSELQWREIYGKCADSAFWSIMDQMNALDVSTDPGTSMIKNMKEQENRGICSYQILNTHIPQSEHAHGEARIYFTFCANLIKFQPANSGLKTSVAIGKSLSQHLKAHWGGASKEDSYDTTMKIGVFSKELNPRLSLNWSQGRDATLIELRQKISEVDQNLKNIQSKKELRNAASTTHTDETSKEIDSIASRKRKSVSSISNSEGLKCMYPNEMKTYAKSDSASKLPTKIFVKVPFQVPFQLVPDKKIEFVKKSDSEFQSWPSFGNPSIEILQKTLPRMPRVYIKDPSKSYTSQDHEALYLEIRLRKECFTSSPVRWLVKKGFLKNRIPCDKCKADLVLKDNPSYKDGSAWVCQKAACHFQKEFTRPAFYAKFDHPISYISLLIYHWACQSDMRTVMSEVPLSLYQILSVWQALREVCSADMKERFVKFGGEKEIVEVAVVQYGNILIIGAMERKTKAVYMGAVPKEFKDKINPFVYLLPSWVLPKSIIVVKSYYSMDGTFTVVSADRNIIDSDNNGYHILNVTHYLEKTVKHMLGHIKETLYADMVQVHLNELMWRERFGKTPQTAFANIIKEISALDQKDLSSVFLNTESLPWALRTGVVCVASAYVHVNKLSDSAVKKYTGLSIRDFLSIYKKKSVIPSVEDKSVLEKDSMNEDSLPEVRVVLEKLDPEYIKKFLISSDDSDDIEEQKRSSASMLHENSNSVLKSESNRNSGDPSSLSEVKDLQKANHDENSSCVRDDRIIVMYDLSSSSKTKCLVEPLKADNFVEPVVVLSKISSNVEEKYIYSEDSSSGDGKQVASVASLVENSELFLKNVTSCSSGDPSSPTEKKPLVILPDDCSNDRERETSVSSGLSSSKDMELKPLIVSVEDSPKHDEDSDTLSPDCCIISPVEKKPSPVVINLEDHPSDACRYLDYNTENDMNSTSGFPSSVIKKEPIEPLTENHERSPNLVVENHVSLSSKFYTSETGKQHTILPENAENPVIQNYSSSGNSGSSEDKNEKLVKCLKGWASSILQKSKCVNSGVSFLTTDKNQVFSVQSFDVVSTTSKKLKEVTNCNKNGNSAVYFPSSSSESQDMPLTGVLKGDSNSSTESSASLNPIKPELIDLT